MEKLAFKVMLTCLSVFLMTIPFVGHADTGSCVRSCAEDALSRGLGDAGIRRCADQCMAPMSDTGRCVQACQQYPNNAAIRNCTDQCIYEKERQEKYQRQLLEIEIDHMIQQWELDQEQEELDRQQQELEQQRPQTSPSLDNNQYMKQYYGPSKTPAKKCPKNSRGMTAAEKAKSTSGAECICLEGFGIDESGTRCVELKYARPVVKEQPKTEQLDDNCMPHSKLSADGMFCDCDEGYEADATGKYCFPVREYSTTDSNQNDNWSGKLPIDTESNAWYSDNLKHFLGQGAIKEDKPFRPSEAATRGELIELIVESLGITLGDIPTVTEPSFDDVPGYLLLSFEKAAAKGITKGDGDCLGTHPCYAYPERKINRAEAATLIFRAFGLGGTGVTGKGPTFTDVEPGSWYAETIRTAGYYCILRGDAGSSDVRPGGNLNRAEMITMIRRAEGQERYPNCQ